ncbi:hypothetical protein CRG98_015276 [Punica granatum]|uniref:Uncharacterized protein n=1 Tax=Punica granatum TaxID=22663 RepID=A0A2I0K6Z5_PUNGR|nr:hypothetical protein CRG98_015276 [Punica granatum]
MDGTENALPVNADAIKKSKTSSRRPRQKLENEWHDLKSRKGESRQKESINHFLARSKTSSRRPRQKLEDPRGAVSPEHGELQQKVHPVFFRVHLGFFRVRPGLNFQRDVPLYPSKARAAMGGTASEQSPGAKRDASYNLWLHPLTEHATKEGQAVSTPFWPTGFLHKNPRSKPGLLFITRQSEANPISLKNPLKLQPSPPARPALAKAETGQNRRKTTRYSGLGTFGSAYGPLDPPLRSPTSPTLRRAVTGASVPTSFFPSCRGCHLSGPSTRNTQTESSDSYGPLPRLFSLCNEAR